MYACNIRELCLCLCLWGGGHNGQGDWGLNYYEYILLCSLVDPGVC